jgi:hypothetical protein
MSYLVGKQHIKLGGIVLSCKVLILDKGLFPKNITQSEKTKITKIYPDHKGSFSDFAFSPFRVGAKKAKIAKTVL